VGQLDQEPFYLSSQDYYEFAIRQIVEEKGRLGALGMLQK
jgi:hypothetical protein